MSEIEEHQFENHFKQMEFHEVLTGNNITPFVEKQNGLARSTGTKTIQILEFDQNGNLQCGRIYEMRLMMDFSGSNRGYMFVRFYTIDEARRAIKELNNYEVR